MKTTRDKLKDNNATSRLFLLLYKLGIYTPLNPLLDYFHNNPAQLPTHMDIRRPRK